MNVNPLAPKPWAKPGDPLGLRLSASAALCDLVRGDIGDACARLLEYGWEYAEPIVAEDGIVCSDWKSTHVVLQGTDSAADVFKDFMFWRRAPWRRYAPGMGWFAVGAKRFANAVLPEILTQLREIREARGAQDVYLHCHSLAAGASALLVIPIVDAGHSVIDVYPFEAPRSLGRGFRRARGSKRQHDDFCRRHQIRFWRILSIRNGVHDWVPLLPPWSWGARQAGESLGFESGRHRGGVVLIRSSGDGPATVSSGPSAKEGWRGMKRDPHGLARWRIGSRLASMPKSHGMEHIAEALGRREFPDQ